MHSTDTKSQFIELRAKGWSLTRIASRINVSPRTLVEWNRQSQAEIRLLRAVELEALQERSSPPTSRSSPASCSTSSGWRKRWPRGNCSLWTRRICTGSLRWCGRKSASCGWSRNWLRPFHPRPPCHPKGETMRRFSSSGRPLAQTDPFSALFLPRFCVIKRVGNQNWSKTGPVLGGRFFDL